jgi:hypothetical protein
LHPVPSPPEKSLARVVTLSPIAPKPVIPLSDPRVPAPELVMVYKQLGYTSQEIADLFEISVSQTRRLLTAGNRETIADSARDYIAKQFVPKLLANIDAALNNDTSARLSLEIADKLGLLADSAASRPRGDESVTETFESYRLSILKRRTIANTPTSETVDATSVRDVSEADPPANESLSPSRSAEGRDSDGALAEP